MKVVILTQYFPPEMGAPQSRLLELGLGLKDLGWQVRVTTAMPNYPTGRIFKDYRWRLFMSEAIEGIEVDRFWMFPSNSSRSLPRVFSMISFSLAALFSVFRTMFFQPEVLIVESPPLTLGITGWILARCSRARFVMNVSDLWPLSAKELGAIKDGTFYRSIERVERFLYAHADACSGQSAEICHHIQKTKPANCFLFRNGVDTRRFVPTSPKPKTNRIVYAGLLGIAQDLMSICQAIDFGALGAELHIYGSGNQRERIEEYVSLHPGCGVFYKGVVNREQVPEILAQFDVALIPLTTHIYGAVPSKIYEALAAGLPLLFSGSGEGAEITRKCGVGWTNEPGAWDALKLNIRHYLSMPEAEFQMLRQHCRSVAMDNFDRSSQVREFETRLRELATAH